MNITETQITILPLAKLVNNNGQIAGVPKNPRTITGDKFRALVERLKANNLTGVNPLKVYEQGGKFVVLGGNQRLRALRELKAESVPCIIVPQDTAAEVLREIVILDNTNDGENDWDALANEWEQSELKEWGVDAANWEQPQEPTDTAADDEEDTDEPYRGEKDERVEELLRAAMKRNIREWVQMLDYCMQAPFGAFLPDGRTVGYAQAQFIRAKYYGLPYHGKNSYIFTPEQFFTKSRSGVSYYDAMQDIINGKEAGVAGFRTMTNDGCLCRSIGNQYRVVAAAAAADFPIKTARRIYRKYYHGGRVLDPCHGWGSRLVTAMMENVEEYVGCDPSPIAHAGVTRLYEAFKQYQDTRATLIQKPYEDTDFEPASFDFAFTCPPYFDVEKYEGEETSTRRYADFELWCKMFYEPLITKTMDALKPDGVFCIVVGSQLYPLADRLKEICQRYGYEEEEEEERVLTSNMHDTGKEGGEDALFVIRKPVASLSE